MKKILIAGVDEAGRGPLAGPVYAAAVILNPKRKIRGLNDSKKLTALQREEVFQLIHERSLSYAVGRASVEEIEAINILQASLLAMQRAIEQLNITPQQIFVDGLHCPKVPYDIQAIVRGDETIAEISAASIVAKVMRDREMIAYDKEFPGYGFAQHKGYATVEHFDAIQKLGICDIHRKTFAPIKQLLIDVVV